MSHQPGLTYIADESVVIMALAAAAVPWATVVISLPFRGTSTPGNEAEELSYNGEMLQDIHLLIIDWFTEHLMGEQ